MHILGHSSLNQAAASTEPCAKKRQEQKQALLFSKVHGTKALPAILGEIRKCMNGTLTFYWFFGFFGSVLVFQDF